MYTQWIALSPESYQGYSNLGSLYVEQGRYSEAIPLLRRSADINPTLDAYSSLGAAYFYQGNFAQAAQIYREAVRVGENEADVYYVWGNLAEAYYWSPGERDRAAETYRHAIALGTERLKVNPRNASVISGLALYHAMLQEKSEAAALSQKALQLDPGDPELQLEAAKVDVELGQYRAAVAALEKARKLGGTAYLARDDPAFRPLASDVQFQKLAQP